MLKKFNQSFSQKEKSLKLLYKTIFEHGSISKSDLTIEVGLAQTTCSRLIEQLVNSKLIKENGFGKSSGGRRPNLYEIEENAHYLIGVDISRTYTKIVLLNLNLEVLEEARLSMDQSSTPQVTIHFIISKVNEMIKKRQVDKKLILGIGIGTIGPLDRENGIILNPINFPSPGWVNIPIRQLLSEALQLDVFLEHGVNTALLAEYQHESFKKYKNVVYVIKGVGNRSSLIIDGRLARGSDKLNMYGQGHMVVDMNGRKCICGNRGCVYAYSSIHAIKEQLADQLMQGKSSILHKQGNDLKNIQFDDICQAVNDGDPVACEVMKDAAYYTGIGLSNLISVLHPDLIILNGPTYTKMDLFFDVVTNTAHERSKVTFANHEVIFSRGNLGENAIAIGAGRHVLDFYLE